MRDVLLSGTAGFLASCAGGFAVHRALWKSASEQSRQLDALVGNVENSSTTTSKRKLVSLRVSLCELRLRFGTGVGEYENHNLLTHELPSIYISLSPSS